MFGIGNYLWDCVTEHQKVLYLQALANPCVAFSGYQHHPPFEIFCSVFNTLQGSVPDAGTRNLAGGSTKAPKGASSRGPDSGMGCRGGP